jgi:hypothetical protein
LEPHWPLHGTVSSVMPAAKAPAGVTVEYSMIPESSSAILFFIVSSSFTLFRDGEFQK